MWRTLPQGIALVRVETPVGRILVCSSELTEEEARVARVAAFLKVRGGALAVVLSMVELAALIEEVT